MKSNHKSLVVKLGEPRVHTNADSLELFDIPGTGYQVVTKKGQFKAGELGVYIQPDSVVPQTEPFKFVWENYEGLDGKVPEKRRRITVRKFRGEWSEGLLLPVSDFLVLYDLDNDLTDRLDVVEGQDVSYDLGITHYDPDAGKEDTRGENEIFSPRKRKRFPRSIKGWFFYVLHFFGIYGGDGGKDTAGYNTEDGIMVPHFDVEAFKNYKNVFQPGEQVTVSEKIHGSNARYVYLDGHMYAGSRTQWKSPTSPCIWRKALASNPWIEEFCRANEGHVLYGEMTPTQGDKFTYGSKEPQLFVFDVMKPDGTFLDANGGVDTTLLDKHWVPVLYYGPFDLEKISKLLDGPSVVSSSTVPVREGVVIRPYFERHERGLGRVILKLVSNKFLEKDSK
jgi:hypothetical protein